MSRGVVLLFPALLGCVATRASLPEGVSCQDFFGAQPSVPRPELDLVIAISSAPAMAAHHDAVVRGLTQLGAYLVGSRLSLHVAVVSDDPGSLATYLVDLDVPWFLCPDGCRTRNYTSTLDSALVTLGALGATGTPATPLFARLEHALGGGGGFLAPEGHLGVLIVSAGDDDSVGDAAGYAQRLAALVPPDHALFAAVTSEAAPRLDAFLAASGRFSGRASLDGDWSDALLWDSTFREVLSLACLRDADPTTCTATDRDADLPHCLMATPERPDPATPLPCFWIKHSADCPSGGLEPIVERRHPAGRFDALLRCTCSSE